MSVNRSYVQRCPKHPALSTGTLVPAGRVERSERDGGAAWWRATRLPSPESGRVARAGSGLRHPAGLGQTGSLPPARSHGRPAAEPRNPSWPMSGSRSALDPRFREADGPCRHAERERHRRSRTGVLRVADGMAAHAGPADRIVVAAGRDPHRTVRARSGIAGTGRHDGHADAPGGREPESARSGDGRRCGTCARSETGRNDAGRSRPPAPRTPRSRRPGDPHLHPRGRELRPVLAAHGRRCGAPRGRYGRDPARPRPLTRPGRPPARCGPPAGSRSGAAAPGRAPASRPRGTASPPRAGSSTPG